MSKQPTELEAQRAAEPNQTNPQLQTLLFSNGPFFAALFQRVEAISDYSVAWTSFSFLAAATSVFHIKRISLVTEREKSFVIFASSARVISANLL